MYEHEPHTAFIVAAYLIAAFVIGSMIAATIGDHWALKRALKRFGDRAADRE